MHIHSSRNSKINTKFLQLSNVGGTIENSLNIAIICYFSSRERRNFKYHSFRH